MLELPAGRLTLDKPLKLTRAQTVLRGAGAKRTTLYLPKSFTDLYGGWWASMGEAGFLAARLAASSVLPAPVRLCGKLRVASPALLKAQTVNICYLRRLLASALQGGRVPRRVATSSGEPSSWLRASCAAAGWLG